MYIISKLLIIIIILFPNLSLAKINKFISYKDAWIKLPIGKQKVTSGYIKIKNLSNKNLKLISINSDFSEKTEIHKMKVVKNVMKMNKVNLGILLPSNKEIEFKLGGLHIMFLKITKKINLDEIKNVYFKFEKHGILKIPMKVKNGNHLKKHKH